MSKLFLDKYRIKSSRKRGYDYTSPGVYFITINTDAQIHWFGSILNGTMRLSDIGMIVKGEWLKSEYVRDNIELDEYIIMPNHVHGIIIIKGTPVETAPDKIGIFNRLAVSSKTQNNKNQYRAKTLKPNSIGSIICQFKSICTKKIRNRGFKYFKWQDRYYDQNIRDENELNKIRYYIKTNPMRF